MRTSSPSDLHDRRGRAALLWDESFLWGIMANKALAACGLACDLIRAGDVRNGILSDYSLLFVPGGWASNKMKALGDDGVQEIKRFVREGGAYLGFCGGAGLATLDGIGLLPVKRRPTSERVPSFSGRVRLNTSDHRLWNGIAEPVFHAWWPSQFLVGTGIPVLATYGDALPDAFSSDMNVGDAEASGGWAELERIYQINLDPKRLKNEPAVIQGMFGKGTVLLSLVHFDTPDDGNGAMMLRNIWSYFGIDHGQQTTTPQRPPVELNRSALYDPVLTRLEAAVGDLIDLGLRNFLWFWRNPQLLQWKRGVRGLEYCTLYIMVRELADIARSQDVLRDDPDFGKSLDGIRDLLLPFVEKAKLLLVQERRAMQQTQITYERCDDPDIRSLREELFSPAKSHGGRFKQVIDELDRLIYGSLNRR